MIWLFLFACVGSEPTIVYSETRPPSVVTADPILGSMRAKPLDYTRHARCRMGCRHIDEDEVEEILRIGTVDPARTRHDEGKCPSYAVEGTTSDAQRVRIVYADCARETRVVTAIDLGEDWPCDCD